MYICKPPDTYKNGGYKKQTLIYEAKIRNRDPQIDAKIRNGAPKITFAERDKIYTHDKAIKNRHKEKKLREK